MILPKPQSYFQYLAIERLWNMRGLHKAGPITRIELSRIPDSRLVDSSGRYKRPFNEYYRGKVYTATGGLYGFAMSRQDEARYLLNIVATCNPGKEFRIVQISAQFSKVEILRLRKKKVCG